MKSCNESLVAALANVVGKEIAALDLNEVRLLIQFTDGSAIMLCDEEQHCCERRYMHSDDDIQAFVGTKLMDAEVREAPEIEHEYNVHEVAFLLVTTSVGVFTIETHNKHNGYYGGFQIEATIVA